MSQFLLLLLFIFFSFCNINKQKKIEEKSEVASIYLKNFQQTKYSSDGNLKLKINAEKSYIFLEKDLTNLYNIHIFQYEKNKLMYEIKGKNATFDNINQEIILKGKVLLKSGNNRSLSSEFLKLDMENDNLYSNTVVKIQSGENIIKGKGLKAKKDLSNFTIFEPFGVIKENSSLLDF